MDRALGVKEGGREREQKMHLVVEVRSTERCVQRRDSDKKTTAKSKMLNF